MPVLFKTLGSPSYRIFGDPDEPAAWACSCKHGEDHLHHRGPGGEKGHPCKHLSRLWSNARERGELDLSYFEPTADGDTKADACRCNGEATPLRRVGEKPEAPPAGPPPGQPSRNQPCPCGWVDPAIGRVREYKRCHGAPGGPPEGAPKKLPRQRKKAAEETAETKRERAARGQETRRAHLIERRERAELAAALGEAGDERRRAVRALSDARRRGADPEKLTHLAAAVQVARGREATAKERAKAKR